MKRLICYLLVVTIACAGCEVKESSTSRISGPDIQPARPDESHTIPGVTITPAGPGGWEDRWDMYSELIQRIKNVEIGLSGIKGVQHTDRAMLSRLSEIDAAIFALGQKKRDEKNLMIRMDEIEAQIRTQGAEIDRLRKAYQMYEVSIEQKKVTIEGLRNLCRMYEDTIELLIAVIDNLRKIFGIKTSVG